MFGPGLVVMLADTDVGSVIIAGQSGARWGYRLLALQLLLVPILYMAQELAVRLAIFTGRGHGELIRDTFGQFWAWVSAVGLGIANWVPCCPSFPASPGVGELYGLPRYASLPIAAAALLAVVFTGSYRRVERVAIAVGLFELAFFVAWAAHPDVAELLSGSVDIPFGNPDYRYLAAANIGAVIMPWMIFLPASAVVDKRLRPDHLTAARWDTAAGALLTQLIMAAVLIACAATIGRENPGASLTSVGDMAQALTPPWVPRWATGIWPRRVGAGMVAAIVASLAFAWGLGEVTGYRRSLELHPLKARWFYTVYVLCVVAGAGMVGVWPDLVSLNVDVEVMNALLLPVGTGIPDRAGGKGLARARRLQGGNLWTVVVVVAFTCALGVFGGLWGGGLM